MSSCIHPWTSSEVVSGTLSWAGHFPAWKTKAVGRAGAPDTGGDAPALNVAETDWVVPVGMPEVIWLRGGTPVPAALGAEDAPLPAAAAEEDGAAAVADEAEEAAAEDEAEDAALEDAGADAEEVEATDDVA